MKRLLILFILSLLGMGLWAQEKGETIRLVLNTGAEKIGTVRFANEAVVVLVDGTGAAYQYQRSEIMSLDRNWSVFVDSEEETKANPVGIQLALAGGYKCVEADLFVGHRHLTDRKIFLGGGLGYHLEFVEDGMWHFLPLMARVELPFLVDKPVTPYAGMNVGYAFAMGKERKASDLQLKGGALGQLDLGARFYLEGGRQVSVSLFGRVQGYGSNKVTIDVDDAQQETQTYTFSGKHMLWNAGVRVAITL